jgi:tellurite resistance protein TerC
MLLVDFFKVPSWISLLVIFSIPTTAALSSWYVARIETKQREKTDPFI